MYSAVASSLISLIANISLCFADADFPQLLLQHQQTINKNKYHLYIAAIYNALLLHQNKHYVNKYAVIVAGGSGSRMGGAIPKQFQLINGKPVLFYTIEAFLNSYTDLKVILVLPEEHLALGREIVDGFFDYSRIQITMGGRTRFHSVQNGLLLVQEESVVFVHDAVRCLVSQQLIQRCFEGAITFGSAIPVTGSRDSIRLLLEEGNEAIERAKVKLVQTPQTFHSKILLPAFNIDYKDWFTDEATVVEAFGLKVHLVEGEEGNIKVTYPTDMSAAAAILTAREQ
jgi:2-C-methyl-D-erythritol 4-phosphate cytidylyltransferase